MPNPNQLFFSCAFTRSEIATVRKWVESGGSLFLIVDHMPFPGAAGDLARAFGVEFSNGFAVYNDESGTGAITFTPESGLMPGPWTEGHTPEDKVDSVVTFTGSAFYVGGKVGFKSNNNRIKGAILARGCDAGWHNVHLVVDPDLPDILPPGMPGGDVRIPQKVQRLYNTWARK